VLNLAIEKGLFVAQCKGVTIGEDTYVSRYYLPRVDWVGDGGSRWGNGNTLLMERICDRRSGHRGLDDRSKLWACRRHRFAVGQGHRCRAR